MSSNQFLYFPENKKLMTFGKERLPEFKTITSIRWVIYGDAEGWKNQYPQYCEYLENTSTKNGAILKAKNRYVYGKGLELTSEWLGRLEPTEQIPAKTFLKEIKDSKVLKKIVKDKNRHKGFAVEMIQNNKGDKWMPHYLPFKNVRISQKVYDEKKNNELKPREFYYTSDWSKQGQAPSQNKDFVVFHPFPWDVKEIDSSKRYIVYYNEDENEDYPLPDYVQGISYISADSEVGNFVEKNTKNSFSGGYLIQFNNGTPTEDQKRQIVEQFDAVLHGTDNAGKSVKSFNDDKEHGVEITPLSANGQDERYININKTIREEIFTAHCTPVAAVEIPPSANGLTNNADQDRIAIEKWQEGWVIPQQEPLNEFFNALFEINEIRGEVAIQRLPPIKPQLSETVLKESLSDAQFREYFDLPPSDQVVNPVLDALRTLSPLVQNKILDSLALSEIRGLIDLTTSAEGVTIGRAETLRKFSKEDDTEIIKHFEAFGFDDTEYEVLHRKELFAKDVFDAKRQAETMAFEFANKTEDAVLNLIANGNTSPKEISDLLKIKTKEVNAIVKSLEGKGLLTEGQITPEGADQIEENEVFAVYKYELRDDAPKLVPGGESREFCKEMMRLSQTRSWTINDIQNISNQVGYDVFTRRGGWYHNPRTDTNQPYCRHIFTVRLVRKK